MNCFILDENTLFYLPKQMTKPVKHAADILFRDFEKVFGTRPRTADSEDSASVVIRYSDQIENLIEKPESFQISFSESSNKMYITGSDDLGIIYALLYISEKHLGVDPFWFWTEKVPERKEKVEIPAINYISPQPKVRFRGWFVNDEVCLIGWTCLPPKSMDACFETLLRCGGNMVIAGTDLPNRIHWELA